MNSKYVLKIGTAVLLTIFIVVVVVTTNTLDKENRTLHGMLNSISFNAAPTAPPSRLDKLGEELGGRYKEILSFCGELCDITREITPAPIVGTIKAEVNCPAIFASEEIDRPSDHEPKPLEDLPKTLQDEFLHYGKVEYLSWYINEQQQTFSETKIYTASEVQWYVDGFKNEQPRDNYGWGSEMINNAADFVGIEGKKVLVIGTQNPWLEAVMLTKNPELVMTLEYGSFVSEYPTLEFVTPKVFRERYMNGTLPLFDVIATYSSLEHSGLGRYGDALNPWGDILTIARVSCVTAPGAKLLIGLPTGGKDMVQFNAHRVYGPDQYPRIATNWKYMWSSSGEDTEKFICPTCADHTYQPVYVFERNE